MKLAGVVILYYPDAGLPERIASYRKRLDKLYIMDNSERPHLELVQPLLDHNSVHYAHTGENRGIAQRLNEAARMAEGDGMDWLLTMDQDSYFENDSFADYLDCISNYAGGEKVAMFGIEYDKREKGEGTCSFKKVNQLITSGSLLRISAFQQTGPFDEALFIDNVDHEYCFRARLQGFDLVKFNSLVLCHTLGLVSQHRSLKNFRLTPRTLHSAIRLYYMLRNFLYLRDRYREHFGDDIRIIQKNLFFSMKNNLLYNKNKGKVARYLLQAVLDYRKGRMGKISS